MQRSLLVLTTALVGFVGSASSTFAALLQVGPTRQYKKPSQAAAAAHDGDMIEIDAGVYERDATSWQANGLTIRGVGGLAHMKSLGTTVERKAIWVIKGDTTTVENIEFSGAKVPNKNGAGIRQEGSGLTVRGCYFHDNEMGILAGINPTSDILIERSEFERQTTKGGIPHNIYIGGVRSFTLLFSYSHHAKVGHTVKSRAGLNYILYNRLMDEATGESSYAIDLPNGGTSYVIGNLIQQGPLSPNSVIVAYGAEGITHPDSDLYFVNNTVVNDKSSGTFLYVDPGAVPAMLVNNLFVGPGTIVTGPAVEITNLHPAGDGGLVNRAAYDYHLTASSPAIDAGSDPGSANGFDLTPMSQYVHEVSGEARPNVGPLDVGAYEYQPPN